MNRIVLPVFIIFLLSLSILPIFISSAKQNSILTVWIKIHRIQKIDEIEDSGEDGADWHYYIRVWDGNKWLAENDTAPEDQNDVIVDEAHTFPVQTLYPIIDIALADDDATTASDIADISAHDGGGYNDTEVPPRGAKYKATFNLTNNELTGDQVVSEEEYLKTSGDYDGSVDRDENDASLWFKIWDNYELPVADAGPDKTVYSGDEVNFNGSGSTASKGSYIVKYEWDFENNGVFDEEGEIVVHSYPESGAYPVVLKVTDNWNMSDIDMCVIHVQNREPIASFTYSPFKPTIRDTINFEDASEDLDGTIISWHWEFGDGATSIEQNSTYQYGDKGNYTVTLTVTDDEEATHTVNVTVKIYNLSPTANFTYFPANPTIGEDVEFTDTSTDPEGKLTSCLWDFGDEYTSTARNATHQYETKGTYSVTLKVTDDEGDTHTTSKTVTITGASFYNQSWFLVAVGIVIVFVVLVVALAWRKRKATWS